MNQLRTGCGRLGVAAALALGAILPTSGLALLVSCQDTLQVAGAEGGDSVSTPWNKPDKPGDGDSGGLDALPDGAGPLDTKNEADSVGPGDGAGGTDAGPADGTVLLPDGTPIGEDVDPDLGPPPPPDADKDGLSDAQEMAWGTDPNNPDSDGDLVPDGEEVSAGTNPLLPDSDKDGATDGEEKGAGTDPMNPDTDKDGLSDGEELKTWGSNPNDKDSDGDGLYDGSEVDAGLDPLNADTDKDQVTDPQEPLGLVCAQPDPVLPQFVQTLAGGYTLAVHKGAAAFELAVDSGSQSAFAFDYDWNDVKMAAFVVSLTPPGGQTDVQVLSEQVLSVASNVCTATVRTSGNKGKSFDGKYEQMAGVILDLTCANPPPLSGIRNSVVTGLLGGPPPNLPAPFGPAKEKLVLTYLVQSRGADRMVVVGVVASLAEFDNATGMCRLYADDLVDGSALANYLDSVAGVSDFTAFDDDCQQFVGKTAKADLIWSVDNSGSMSDDQKTLADNVPKFTALLANAGVDYRLAVTYQVCSDLDGSGKQGLSSELVNLILTNEITGKQTNCTSTDNYSGPKNGNLCDGKFTTNLSSFSSCALKDYSGGSSEYTLSTGMMAIDRALPRKDNDNTKLRPDATTILVLLTDEHEQAFEKELSWLGDKTPTDAGQLAQLAQVTDPYIQWLKADPVNAKVFGMFVIPGQGGEAEGAVGMYRVVTETGGSCGHLPTGDLVQTMKEIISAAIGYSATTKLTHVPIPMTVQVARGAQGQPGILVPRSRENGFEYDALSNGIVFHGSHVPKEGEDIAVWYLYWLMVP